MPVRPREVLGSSASKPLQKQNVQLSNMSHLLEFYGTECPHCVSMHKLVERLEKEGGIKVESLEVWHNKENEKRLLELDKNFCGGVPFFL